MPQCERQPPFYHPDPGHRAACWLLADKEVQA
jgi:peptide/nickel transport system ATP-binding protein